jgi:hypothetical protein
MAAVNITGSNVATNRVQSLITELDRELALHGLETADRRPSLPSAWHRGRGRVKVPAR